MASSPSPIPIPSPKKKPARARVSSLPADFIHFWQAYPQKVGKKAAERAWKTHKPNLQACLTALEWQTKTKQWLEGFIPNPATWINQHRWLDEPMKELEKPDSWTPEEAERHRKFRERYESGEIA